MSSHSSSWLTGILGLDTRLVFDDLDCDCNSLTDKNVLKPVQLNLQNKKITLKTQIRYTLYKLSESVSFLAKSVSLSVVISIQLEHWKGREIEKVGEPMAMCLCSCFFEDLHRLDISALVTTMLHRP